MAISSKVAVNPLPWVLGPDGFDLSPATVRAAVAGIAEAGFSAIHADVPENMPVPEYRALLEDHGVRPAPGYFGAYFDIPPDEVLALADAAKRHAAVQAELGLSEVFLASHLDPARITSPASGADFDPARLELVIDRIRIAAEAITSQGVTPCFHPHVGSLIETEYEIRTMLDSVGAAVLSFGPDTGHLFWAGIDPARIIADYAGRVGAVHLKDVHRKAAVRVREVKANYADATYREHVWTEPGRGDIDFDAIFTALPSSYDGWFVVEVDVPDLPTREQSTAASARWVAAQFQRERA
jgi:inosose dehydratase